MVRLPPSMRITLPQAVAAVRPRSIVLPFKSNVMVFPTGTRIPPLPELPFPKPAPVPKLPPAAVHSARSLTVTWPLASTAAFQPVLKLWYVVGVPSSILTVITSPAASADTGSRVSVMHTVSRTLKSFFFMLASSLNVRSYAA